MSRPSYDAAPNPNLLPPEPVQEQFGHVLSAAPGLDLLALHDGSRTDMLDNGYHVRARVRPGFNGNVCFKAYTTADHQAPREEGNRGQLNVRGYGYFSMVYENPQHIVPYNPMDRIGPDYAPLRFDAGGTEIIALQNGGRLLISQAVTKLSAYEGASYTEQSYWQNVTLIERVVNKQEVPPLLGCLAASMGLEGPDAATFAAQPARKIVPLMGMFGRLLHRK